VSPKTKARLAAKIAEDIRQAHQITVLDPRTGKGKKVPDPFAASTLEAGGRAVIKEVLPTGSMVLDKAILGVGGLAWGRIYEIAGAESAGKTTIACRIMAEAQKDGAVPILTDKENKFHTGWAAKHGLVLEDCVEHPAAYVEAYHDEVLRLLDKHGKKTKLLFVLDSVPALLPKAYIDGDLDDKDVPGALGKAWSRGLAKLSPALLEYQAILLVLNQLRSKIGNVYGPSEDTPAGRALKHYASGRFWAYHGETIKKGEVKVGRYMKIKASKNNLTGTLESVVLKMMYETGFDDRWSVLEYAKQMGAVESSSDNYEEALANLGWGPPVPGVE
jgi:recombination protein RecA